MRLLLPTIVCAVLVLVPALAETPGNSEVSVGVPQSKATISASSDDTDIVEVLRKKLEELLNKIQDKINNHKLVAKDLIEKLKALWQKLKDANKGLKDKLTDLFKKVEGQFRELYQKIIDKLNEDPNE